MLKGILLAGFLLLHTVASHAQTVFFYHKNNSLEGIYLPPTKEKTAKGIILFVHGDGAMNYNAEGYYDLVWEPLRSHGYAVFSWSKPGVGNSSGNWLSQTMQDRQSEVLAAIEFVQNQYGFNNENTGLLGFSQAGWVIPALARSDDKISFAIGIGFATNWIEQGRYLTATSAKLEGGDEKQISEALKDYNKVIELFKTRPSYDAFIKKTNDHSMTQARYQFVLSNFKVDATEDYNKIKVPVLLMWGKEDLNVDAITEFNYLNELQHSGLMSTGLLSNATHGLLKADTYNVQTFGFWHWLLLMWEGEDAFASDFMPRLLSWLDLQLP